MDKSAALPFVIPAQAEIQLPRPQLDSRLRGNDESGEFTVRFQVARHRS
jgi:hypothetical protein